MSTATASSFLNAGTRAGWEEILSLAIEDLDLEFRRGRVHSIGGAIEYVHWATTPVTAPAQPRPVRPPRQQTSAQVTADVAPPQTLPQTLPTPSRTATNPHRNGGWR